MVHHEAAAFLQQLPRRVLRKIVEQEVSLGIKKAQHNGNRPRQNHGERIGQHEVHHFIHMIHICQHQVVYNDLRQARQIGNQRDPCLYDNRFVGAELKTVKQVSHRNRASTDQLQIEIGAARRKQPGQNGNQKHNRIVDNGAGYRGEVHEQAHGESDSTHNRDYNHKSADGRAVMSEQMLSGAGFQF